MTALAIVLTLFLGWLLTALVFAVAVGRFIAAGNSHLGDDAP